MRPSQHNIESRSSTILAASLATSCTITLLLIASGLILTLFRLKSLKGSRPALNTEPHPANPPDAQVIPVYESVFPMEFQEENMMLNDNIAYGPLPVARAFFKYP